jgi:hypothetical protein
VVDHPLIIIARVREHRIAELETLVIGVLAAVLEGSDGAINPPALTFLLREYRATDRADLGEALGRALAIALDRYTRDVTVIDRAAWLTLFAETLAISEDDRLRAAVDELVAQLRTAWPGTIRADEGAVSIDACLRAASIVDAHELIPAAVDELERIIGGAYRPGQGVGPGLHLQVRAAAALLTAHEIAGRLPYAMLAEELMQGARRGLATEPDFELNCDAARVLCRLALLHDDVDYCAAAVIAPYADYYTDAERILDAQSPLALARGFSGAPYGIALREWLTVRQTRDEP